MNAIAGCIAIDPGDPSPRGTCEAMLRAQSLYAPDPPAVWSGPGAAVGRRLRPVLPEDVFDRGPIVDARGRVLVADARLDNRAELARLLDIGGTQQSLSEAGMLATALARWDVSALDRIVGDFAFAWWDPARRRLILARDYIGHRPLHYHTAREFAAFASMPRGLLALPDVPSAPDIGAVTAFARLERESADRSFHAGIAKVPAGHWVAIEDGRVSVHRYWFPPTTALKLSGLDAYVEAVRAHLDTAVSAQLRGAEDGVATHLSAGLDSSAVTATAARILTGIEARVTAYTAVPHPGFATVSASDDLIDEGPLAGEVARRFPNIDHRLVRSGHRSPIDTLERAASLYDRPLLNLLNMTWSDAILDDVRARGHRVLLTGAMGNASFSYNGIDRLGELFRTARWVTLAREAAWLARGGTPPRAIAGLIFGQTKIGQLIRAILRAQALNDRIGDYTLARSQVSSGTSGFRFPSRGQGAVQSNILAHADTGNYRKGILGGWGVDMRDPTADKRLVEFCLSVPVENYLSQGIPRALARRALADRVPSSIINERRRGRQAADWSIGVSAARNAICAEFEHISRDRSAMQVLDLDRAATLLVDWPEDLLLDANPQRNNRYRHALMRALTVGHFLRTVNGTN